MEQITTNNASLLAAIASVTLISITALIICLGGRFDSSWSQKNGFSITIEGRQTSEKINDCLPQGKSSHRLNCDNQ